MSKLELAERKKVIEHNAEVYWVYKKVAEESRVFLKYLVDAVLLYTPVIAPGIVEEILIKNGMPKYLVKFIVRRLREEAGRVVEEGRINFRFVKTKYYKPFLLQILDSE